MIPIDEVVHFDVTTHRFDTGAVSDADSAPTFDVFEEATDTPILDDQTMTKRTSLTGNYRGTFTASAANGFEAGKWYSVVVSATVNSVAAKYVAKNFRVGPAESVAGVPKVDAAAISGDATAADNLESYLDGTEFMPVDAHKQNFSVSGTSLTTKKPDGTTDTAYSPKTVTTDPSAEPITGAS